MSVTTIARKAVGSFVTVVSGWVIFVLQSDPARITSAEVGLLIGGLTTVFVTWLVPNDPPPRWDPPARDAGQTDLGNVLSLFVLVLLIVLLLRALGHV